MQFLDQTCEFAPAAKVSAFMPTSNWSDQCPACGSKGFNPACPECKEMEETLRHLGRSIEGFDK